MIKRLALISLLIVNLITPSYALTERYANCGLGTGDNDGTSKANAYRTLALAMAGVAAGDRVNVIDSTECDITATITTSTNGTADNPIHFRGYTSSIGDGGNFVVDGQSTANDCYNIEHQYYIFSDFEVKSCLDEGFESDSNGDYMILENGYINNITNVGIDANGSTVKLLNMEITSTGDDGVQTAEVRYSYLHDIGDYGFAFGTHLYDSIIATTGVGGAEISSDRTSITGNTFYNSVGDNILYGSSTEFGVAINNIFHTAGDWNVEIPAGGNLVMFKANVTFNATSGTVSGTVFYSDGNITDDPGLDTSNFTIGNDGKGANIDNLAYPTQWDGPSGGTTIDGLNEPGAISYEETGSAAATTGYGFAQ